MGQWGAPGVCLWKRAPNATLHPLGGAQNSSDGTRPPVWAGPRCFPPALVRRGPPSHCKGAQKLTVGWRLFFFSPGLMPQLGIFNRRWGGGAGAKRAGGPVGGPHRGFPWFGRLLGQAPQNASMPVRGPPFPPRDRKRKNSGDWGGAPRGGAGKWGVVKPGVLGSFRFQWPCGDGGSGQKGGRGPGRLRGGGGHWNRLPREGGGRKLFHRPRRELGFGPGGWSGKWSLLDIFPGGGLGPDFLSEI